MPLAKVTDMSFQRFTMGRILGYGEFILESAGQGQALNRVDRLSYGRARLSICAIAARRLAAVRPVVAALAGIAAPDAFWELCRDELSGVDVAAGGWDIRARWFGVVICATPRLGEPGRGVTIPWHVIAALITAQQPRGC